MRLTVVGAVLSLAIAGCAGPVRAQDSTITTASSAQPSCDAPQYRQFDFWVGEWEVTNEGKKAGENRITKEVAGCLIHEHWTGVSGSSGQSMNFYDRSTGKWHQVWIDKGGSVLNLSGVYANRRLHYTGEAREEGGKRVSHELTFFDNANGTVRQLWRASEDGGRTWQTLFDGLYQKKPRSATASP